MLDDAPDDREIDRVVTVHENVPKRQRQAHCVGATGGGGPCRAISTACYDEIDPAGTPVTDTTTEATFRWTRERYDRAVEAGVFGPDDRLELIEGQLLAMNPQGSRHAAIVDQAGEVLREAFGAGFRVRIKCPLVAGEDSEPEPDLAVVPGRARDYLDAHPTSALLVVEVSDDSLRRDRIVKQRLYARHGIPEYWILALPDARLEVYRDPTPAGYRTVLMRRAGETIAPLARPSATIAVADLLP